MPVEQQPRHVSRRRYCCRDREREYITRGVDSGSPRCCAVLSNSTLARVEAMGQEVWLSTIGTTLEIVPGVSPNPYSMGQGRIVSKRNGAAMIPSWVLTSMVASQGIRSIVHMESIPEPE